MKNKRIFLWNILLIILIYGIATILISQNNAQNMSFNNHYIALNYIQKKLKPKTYLEIGVEDGYSINLTLPQTIAIGVDPYPSGHYDQNVKIFKMESDKFFKDKNNIKNAVGDENFDLIFIDGMHLYENALKDFINSEKYANKSSIIILHDTIPLSKSTSARKSLGKGIPWTGDVYKIVPALKKYRPDLKIQTFVVAPSGLCFITNLDPKSTTLSKNYNKIYNEFKNLTYEDFVNNEEKNIDFIANSRRNLDQIIKNHVFR